MSLKFFMPTKVCFGRNAVVDNASLLRALGSKALVVTGRRSAKVNGSLRDMEAALQAVDVPYAVYDAISSNPSIKQARDAAGVARSERADLIIGIGGGSPMDAAKAIAVLATNDVDDAGLFSGQFDRPVLPVVAVPTTAGTGSEVTQYSILTNDSIQSKSSIASGAIFPRLALLDPRYLEQLPPDVTANTMVDALSHAVEGYLSVKADSLSSVLARESMSLIGPCLKSLQQQPSPATRERLLYASMLAGMVIAQTGTTAVHAMGYSLTYFKDVDHGKANGLLMYEFLRFLDAHHEGRVADLLRYLGLASLSELKDCLQGLLSTELKLTSGEVELYSSIAIRTGNIKNTPVPLTQGDLSDMFTRSFAVAAQVSRR